MTLWLKIKVWTKITVFCLVMAYAGLFIWNNYDEWVTLRIPFREDVHIGLLSLVLYTLLAGIIGTLLFRMVWRTIRQLRELGKKKQQNQLHEDVADLKSKAAMLQTKPEVPTNAQSPS